MHEVDRCRRVSELIRRELSTLIAREVSDQRVKMASITAVTISKDLKQATVYVSSVEQSTSPAEIENALNHAGKYLALPAGPAGQPPNHAGPAVQIRPQHPPGDGDDRVD